jgi:hypothetical protein
MLAATSKPDLYNEGYPRSSEADLDPGPERCESLEEADLVISDEHRVVLVGRGAGGSRDDETSFEDADDVESR